MGFLDRFNPDERRWRQEAKQEAREYRQEAKEILADAKDLYDDYKDLKSETQRVVNELSDLIRSYNNYKADMLKELSGEVNSTIENFRRFNVGSRVTAPPSINSAPSIPTVTVSSIMANLPGGSFNPISIALSIFSDPYKDREKALDQKYAAQDYYYKVQDALTDMKILYESLTNSRRYIQDEKSNLTQLMDKVRRIVNQLNEAMTRNFFTENEARYMTGISKIAEMIKNSLEQRIVSKSGDIEGNYKLCGAKIRELNGAIPAAPNISSSSAWLDRLLTY